MTGTTNAAVPASAVPAGVINTSDVPLASATGLTDSIGQGATFVGSYWWVFVAVGLVLLLVWVL